MLMKASRDLQAAGVEVVRLDSPPECDALIQIHVDSTKYRFAVEQRRRAPYPSEISSFLDQHEQLDRFGTPMLLAPYISEGIGRALIENAWSWADEVGNFELRAKGLRLRQRVSASPTKPATRTLPQGGGALTIIRFLISQSDPATTFGPTELASIARVSQPRASQVLARLRQAGFAERALDGWRTSDREALLDAFLHEYRGPSGSETSYYSLDPPQQTAVDIAATMDSTQARIAISADVGPDLVAPWRSPSHLILYVDRPIDPTDLDLVEAEGRADASLLLRIPDDMSVFRFLPLEVDVRGTSLPLADEAQMIWDLHDLGGDDR